MSTSPDSFSAEEHDAEEHAQTVHDTDESSVETTDNTATDNISTENSEPATTDMPEEPKQAGEVTIDPMSLLPPEAQGETNGGPLGCCLGVMIGLLLSISIAVLSRIYADNLAHVFTVWLSLVIRSAMILLAIIAVIICGYSGWKIGKIAYREYDPPAVRTRKSSRK